MRFHSIVRYRSCLHLIPQGRLIARCHKPFRKPKKEGFKLN